MADEVKNTGPALDQDALIARVNENTSALLTRAFETRDRQDQERRDTERADAEAAGRRQATFNRNEGTDRTVDPVAAAVMPVVGPAINHAAIVANMARDEASFWASDEGKRAGPHVTALKRASDAMLANGAPLKMGDIWNWYQGANRAKFEEQATAERQAAEKRATEAAAAAAGQGRTIDTNSPAALRDPYHATQDDLTKALAGVSF